MILHTGSSAMSMTLIQMGKQVLKLRNSTWFWDDHPDDPKMETQHLKLMIELIHPQKSAYIPDPKNRPPELRGERIRKQKEIAQGPHVWGLQVSKLTCRNSAGRFQQMEGGVNFQAQV